jgi:hypothetical protein
VSDPTGVDDAPASKGLLRRSLDVCVFAPVGLAVTVAEDLPELVAKGRARVEQDLNNARIVGRYVVHREWRRVSQHLATIFGSGRAPAPRSVPDEPVPQPEPAASALGSPAVSQDAPAAVPPVVTPDEPAVAPPAEPRVASAADSGRPLVPDAAAEAIVAAVLADYDTLSASQVVRRLEGLGPDELRAVQRYEASTRNRRTILNRASQLLDEGPAAAQSG